MLDARATKWTPGPELPGDRFDDAAFLQEDGTLLVVGAQGPILEFTP